MSEDHFSAVLVASQCEVDLRKMPVSLGFAVFVKLIRLRVGVDARAVKSDRQRTKLRRGSFVQLLRSNLACFCHQNVIARAKETVRFRSSHSSEEFRNPLPGNRRNIRQIHAAQPCSKVLH